MDYRNAQASPSKHLTGISVVVGVHLVMGWLVASGVGAGIVKEIVKPIVVMPLLPEKPVLPEPKKLEEAAAPKVDLLYFPPVEIVLIQEKQADPIAFNRPAEAPEFKNASDLGLGSNSKSDSAAPPIAAVSSVGVACPNSQSIRENIRYPAQAQRDGLQGEVEVEFTVSAAGVISGESIVSSTNRAFNSAALLATRQFKCVGQGQDVKVKVPYSFKLAD